MPSCTLYRVSITKINDFDENCLGMGGLASQLYSISLRGPVSPVPTTDTMSGLHTRDIHEARPIFDAFRTILDVIFVVAVGSGWILISVDAGLSGFDRFWTLFWSGSELL